MESVRAGRLYGTPPLGRQDSVDGLHIPSSSCSGSSSWVLWRDVGTPYCETRRRRGRLCSALLALAVLLVVLTVLAIASLAVYMGALRIDTSKSDLVFEGEMRVLSEEHFSPALWDNSSTTFRDRALRYQDMLEAVFHMSLLRPAMRYCSVERFENNGSSLIVFFRLHLDRRKIPRTLLNVEETAKEILVEEVTSLRPVSFRNVLVDSASIFIKRFLDDDGLQPTVYLKDQRESEETNRTVKVQKGVLLKTSPSTTEASPLPEVTELVEKNIPMVEGTYTITKLEEDKPKTRTPSNTTTEPHLVTHKTEHNVLTKRIGDLYNEPQTENVIRPAVGETSEPVILRTNTYNDRYEHHSTVDKSAYLESMGFPDEEWKPVVASPTEEQTWRPHDMFDNLAARRRIADNVTFSTLPPLVSEEPWRPIITGTGVAEVVPLPDDNEFMSRQHSTSAPLFNSEEDVAVSVGKEAFKPQYHERVPALEGLEDKLSTISLHILGTGTAADSPDISILHTSSSGGIIVKKHRNHTETTPVYYTTTPTVTKPANSKGKATTPNPQTTNVVPQLPLLKHFPQLDSIFTSQTQKKGDISEKHPINGSKEHWAHSNNIKPSEAVQLQKYTENNDKLDESKTESISSNIEKQSMSKFDTSSERKHSFSVEETELNDRATASNQPAALDEVTLIFKENSSSTTPLMKTKSDPPPTPFPLITLLPVKSYLGGPLRPRPKIPLVNRTSNQSSIPHTDIKPDNSLLTEQPGAAEALEVARKNSTSNSNGSHLLGSNSDHRLEPNKNENKDTSSSALSSNNAYNNTKNSGDPNNYPLNNDYSTNSSNNNQTVPNNSSTTKHFIPNNSSTTKHLIPNNASINNSNHQLKIHSFSPENDHNHHTISNISSPSEVQDHSRSGNSSVVSAQGTNTSESAQHLHLTTTSSVEFTSSSQEVGEEPISPSSQTENSTGNVISTKMNDAVWHAVTMVKNTPKGNTTSLSIENVTSTTESSVILNTEVVTSTSVEVSYSKNLTSMLEVMPPPETNTSKINTTSKPSHNNKTEENRNATVIEGTEDDLPKIHFQPAIPVPLLTKVKITQRNQTSVRNPVVSHRQPKMGASWLPDDVRAEEAKLILEEIFENLTTGAPSNLLVSSTTETNGLIALNTSMQSSTDANMEINMNFTISKVSTTYNISKKIDEYTQPPTSGTTYARDASTIFVDLMTTTESEGESFPVVTDLEDITTTLSPTTYQSEFTSNMEKSLTGGDNGTMVRVLNAISKFATIHTNSHSTSTKHSKDSHHRGNSTSNEGSTSNEIKNTSVRAEDKVPVNIPMLPLLTKIYNKIPGHKETNKTKNEITSQAELNTTTSQECSGNYSLRCGNGECISAMSRCNQLVNCNDGADERDCSCADYLRAQFLTRKLCDGVVDCWDYSDENNCEWCSPGQFVCPNSQVCVDQQRLCDGARDCPYGDDEKQCVTVSETEVGAGDFPYHSHGFLMVRKQGRWGKLCVNNFETVIARSQATWEIRDLGRAVCKAMTFSDFERVDRTTDPPDDGRSASSSYYELTYTASNTNDTSPRSGLAFQPTTCPRREVIHVSCRDLECGVRPQAVNQWARIVGGGNAGPGSWPWQAALYKEGEFQCGATLISQSWLVSAGHCFYHALDDYWVARLGALRRGTNFPSPYEQLRPIRKIILHPGYVDTGFINDISLLRMREPVAFSDYVRPICLPRSAAELRDSRLCTVVGWGQLFEVGRIFPDTLQEVQLPVISTNECRKRTLFLPLYRVTDNMFCAGFDRGGRDACLGDSGGPLMCQEPDGRWMLYGVTSNGYGCARANRPGVYTKVANYISWMETAMNQPEISSSVQANKTACKGHRCPLGECLPHSRVCNGFMECSDGSDERGCWEPKPQH